MKVPNQSTRSSRGIYYHYSPQVCLTPNRIKALRHSVGCRSVHLFAIFLWQFGSQVESAQSIARYRQNRVQMVDFCDNIVVLSRYPRSWSIEFSWSSCLKVYVCQIWFFCLACNDNLANSLDYIAIRCICKNFYCRLIYLIMYFLNFLMLWGW